MNFHLNDGLFPVCLCEKMPQGALTFTCTLFDAYSNFVARAQYST